jgi:acyl carrier protein
LASWWQQSNDGETIMAADNLARKVPSSIQDIPATLRRLIAVHLDVDQKLVSDDADLLNDLEADWLDIVELIAVIETEFGMEFADEAIDQLKVVGDLIRIVETQGHH